MAGVSVATIVAALEHQKIVSYMDVVSSVLLVYDIVLNLDSEIQHVWRKRWSILTVLYLLQRYLPLFDTVGLILHHHFAEDLSPQYCNINYSVVTWSFNAGVVLSEAVLTLRIWAMWKRSIPVGVLLVLFHLGTEIPSIIVIQRFLSADQYARLPIPHFRGCFISGGSQIIYLTWVCLMIIDTVMLVMILIPAVSLYRMGGRSRLMKALYED
ncbi:hypothetical protein PQX77_006132, partial [Marasmius sp. AFHP31]